MWYDPWIETSRETSTEMSMEAIEGTGDETGDETTPETIGESIGETIGQELPCAGCGYALFGLKPDGVCPECGMEISRSLLGDQLAAADPVWLRGIVRGQRLLGVGMLTVATAIIVILLVLIVFIFTTAFNRDLPAYVEAVVGVFIVVMGFSLPIGLCIALVGTIFVTAQEGRDLERETLGSQRNLARWGMAVAIASAVTIWSISLLGVGGPGWLVPDIIARSIFLLSLTVASIALLRRLEALLRRVPDEKQAKEMLAGWKMLRWSLPIAGIYVLILPRLGLIGGGGPPGGLVGGCFVAVLALAGFVAALRLLVGCVPLAITMYRCVGRFRKCLEQAEAAAAARA